MVNEKKEYKFFNKKKFVGEWNTGEASLNQLALFEMKIDQLTFEIESMIARGKPFKVMMKELYTLIVSVYYRRLRACSHHVLQEAADEKVKEINRLYYEWNTSHNSNDIPIKLKEELNKFFMWLYEVKQKVLNLGIPMREDFTAEQRLIRAIE